MRKLLMALCIIFVWALSAYAGTATLEWNKVDRAKGYKIYASTDLGKTWGDGLDVGDVVTHKYENLPDTTIVLFRISAYNDSGETIRHEFGAWYNGLWKPLDAVDRTGIRTE